MLSEHKLKLIESEFEAIRDVVFLNSCLASVPPLRVREAYRREMEEFVSSHGSEENNPACQKKLREELAWLINAEPDEIALTNNTTAGMDVITLGLDWDPEKEVVIYEREHFANIVDVLLRASEGKFRLKTVPTRPNGVRADDLIQAITPRTQAVFVSDVQYSDGARVDLKRIGRACKEVGALLIVDAIQSLGRLEIDVKEAGVDFLACGGHKGLLVRNGIGFLYCRRELLPRVRPFNGGHMSFKSSIYPPGSRDLPWRDDARRFENGNLNDPGVSALIASMSLMRELGKKDIESRIIELEDIFFKELGENEKIFQRGDLPGGILIFPFPKEKRAEAEAVAAKYNIYGTFRPDNLRVCISFYNTPGQMKTLALAAREIGGL